MIGPNGDGTSTVATPGGRSRNTKKLPDVSGTPSNITTIVTM